MGNEIQSILLIDDDPDDQLLFNEALSEADNSVVYYGAFNGIDALDKLHSEEIPQPDLIFMDVNMPRMNGLDCLRELKKFEKLKSIPVIMYSTSCSLVYQKLCFANGAVNYIEKPNDFLELRNTLKLVLEKGLSFIKNDIPVKP